VSPSPTVLVVRARRALARPAPRRLGVAALAVATGLTVTSLVDGAGAARDRWGDTRPVVVATRDLEPGEVLDGGATAVRDLPAAVLGEAVLAEAPAGAVVRHPIVAGEPVVAARLAPTGLVGAAALVPEGERAVAVPAGPAPTPPLVVGDRVDVLAVLPAAPPGPGDVGLPASDPAFALVEQAAVVDVADGVVTVAVPEADAPRVAWAFGHGSVVLALAGG
jgi:Flp pilus assembly protein CpaB